MIKNFLLAGFAATIVFTSCAPKKEVQQKGTVDLYKTELNQVVNLNVGEVYKIHVKENPSTGHRWTTSTTPNCSVSLTDRYEPGKQENEMMVGVPGTKYYDVKADKPGECTVTFQHVGPGLNAPVVETRILKFVVK